MNWVLFLLQMGCLIALFLEMRRLIKENASLRAQLSSTTARERAMAHDLEKMVVQASGINRTEV